VVPGLHWVRLVLNSEGTQGRRARVSGMLAVLALAAASAWHAPALPAAPFVPMLLAAAWWGARGSLGAAALMTALASTRMAIGTGAGLVAFVRLFPEVLGYWLVAAVIAVMLWRRTSAITELKGAHEETLGALARAMELREKAAAGHSERVRDYALRLADELGRSDAVFRYNLALGAFLHDVGKIGIPDEVLLRQGPLDPAGRESIERHPALGAALIGRIGFQQEARELVLAHHERYNGTGYPRGLARDAIPLGARIFAVADVFDALTTDRPYHAAESWAEAARYISHRRGTEFDPHVADAFMAIPFEDLRRIAARAGTFLRAAPDPHESMHTAALPEAPAS
jgi:putative nucleotidyltransferase with HDIG domain